MSMMISFSVDAEQLRKWMLENRAVEDIGDSRTVGVPARAYPVMQELLREVASGDRLVRVFGPGGSEVFADSRLRIQEITDEGIKGLGLYADGQMRSQFVWHGYDQIEQIHVY